MAIGRAQIQKPVYRLHFPWQPLKCWFHHEPLVRRTVLAVVTVASSHGERIVVITAF